MAHNPPGKPVCGYNLCKRHFDAAKPRREPLDVALAACAECCPDCITERKEKMARMATEPKAAHKRDDGHWYIGDVRMATAHCGHAAIFCNGCGGLKPGIPKKTALQYVTGLSCGMPPHGCCCSTLKGKGVVGVLADGTVIEARDRLVLYAALASREAGEAMARRPQISDGYERPQRCVDCEGVKYLCGNCMNDVESGDGDKSHCSSCCSCQRPSEGAILPNGEYVRGTRDEVTALISEGVDMGGKVVMPMTVPD